MGIVASDDFQHIIRLLNTNVDGREKIIYALSKIRGIGRRFANIICKKGDIDLTKRAGEFAVEQLQKLMEIVADPKTYKIPSWFLNNRLEYKDGIDKHVTASLESLMRETLERLKKIHAHRGIRHYWGVRVRGQHTKTTGRGGAKFRGIGKNKK
jgi:small subunit ribosomal protein S18e